MTKYLSRFWEFVERGAAGDCWRWMGPLKPDGYGFFTARDPLKRTAYAHRHAYELLVGPIPAGLTIDHLCRGVTNRSPHSLAALATSLTDSEYAYVVAKLGESGPARLFGVGR